MTSTVGYGSAVFGNVESLPQRVVALGPVQPDTVPEEAADLEACIHEIAAGSHAALADLYDATNRMVFGMALRVLGDRDLAEDVVVDVYSQVWRRADTYDRRRGAPAAWLLMVARTRAIDVRRSCGREPGGASLDALTGVEADTAGPEELAALGERRRWVRGALQDLTPEQREVIDLAFFGGLSHSEIAAHLGQPLGTVKTRIRLAMSRLRDGLGHLTTIPPSTSEEPAA